MTVVADLAGSSIYLDTNILIHFVEGHAAFAPVRKRLFLAIEKGSVRAFTSELSLAEVLVKPIADGKMAIADAYQTLLSDGGSIRIAPVDRAVLIESARLRATVGGRAFDAIHVATALMNDCSVLLTGDTRLRSSRPETIMRLADLK